MQNYTSNVIYHFSSFLIYVYECIPISDIDATVSIEWISFSGSSSSFFFDISLVFLNCRLLGLIRDFRGTGTVLLSDFNPE